MRVAEAAQRTSAVAARSRRCALHASAPLRTGACSQPYLTRDCSYFEPRRSRCQGCCHCAWEEKYSKGCRPSKEQNDLSILRSLSGRCSRLIKMKQVALGSYDT